MSEELAMGLAANITAVESARALEVATAISIAMGDHKALARAIYETTGSARLAQRVELAAFREKGRRG
jgi:hypothetical protein